jgi:hypothetical protein
MPGLHAHPLLDLKRGERAVRGHASRPRRLPNSLKSGAASFMDSSKYSFFMPQVPSTAEHRSMVSTVAPVSRSRSADLVPMFCAFRWHGS